MQTQENIYDSTCQEPRPEIFYLLPKTHKTGNTRCPIVSDIGTSLKEFLAVWILVYSYTPLELPAVWNKTDFIKKLGSTEKPPANAMLANRYHISITQASIMWMDYKTENIITDDNIASVSITLSQFALTQLFQIPIPIKEQQCYEPHI